MNETSENRLKRLKIRSWRRGTKEMDLILGTFADAFLTELDIDTLNKFECLLEENDLDLYPWFTGRAICPPQHVDILAKIRGAEKYR